MTHTSAVRERRLRLRLTLIMSAIVTCMIVAFSAVVFQAFEDAVAPEVDRRTKVLGALLRSDLQGVLDLGIPLAALGDLDTRVSTIVRDFPEVQRVRILSRSGETVVDVESAEGQSDESSSLGFAARVYDYPVLDGDGIAANILLTGNPRLIEASLFRVIGDIFVVALAIVLVGVEFALALAARSIWVPRESVSKLIDEQRRGRFDQVVSLPEGASLGALAARLNDRALHLAGSSVRVIEISLPVSARLPLFLLAFGTETTASFLPVMAANSSFPDWMPTGVAAAAPLVLYLLSVAVMSPFAGTLSRRVGSRRMFNWSIPLILVGLSVMAFSTGLFGIVLGRGLVAAGYAIALACCTQFAIRAAGPGGTAHGQASINSALFSGVLAGSVIGGVIAFEAGYAAAILAGSVAAVAAAAIAKTVLTGPAGAPSAHTPPSRSETGDRRDFAALLACIALPLGATTAMVIWYLLPLLLTEMRFDAALVARIIMLYYLAAILLPAAVAHAFEGAGLGERSQTLIGATVSAVGIGVLAGTGGAVSVILAIGLIGAGHAILRAPLYALASRASGGKPRWMDILRVAERAGALIGLALAAVLIDPVDPAAALWSLAAIVLSGVLVLTIIGIRGRELQRE